MDIREVIIPPKILEKLEWKHHVKEHEVREVLAGNPNFRWSEKGNVKGEDVYLAFGQTDSGRYLTVAFVYKRNHDAICISARSMDRKERRHYGKTKRTRRNS